MKRKSLQNIYKDRKTLTMFLSLVLVCVFTLTIAYSALSAVLTITGNARVTAADWDIYLSNPKVTDGSATANVPEIKTSSTLEFSTTLNMPGDFYEFTVDVVNGGSIDAMIENVIKTPELDATQKKYLNYVVNYANGESIENKQTLYKNSSMPIKVRVEYRRDISASDLPTSQTNLDLSLTLEYVQSDGSGSSVNNGGYISSSWQNASAVFVGDSITYGASTTKTYWQYLSERYSLSSTINMGINSSTVSAQSDYGTTKSPLIDRYTSIPNADLITIFMGTNDYGHETPLGTINDTTDVSFYGALNVIIPWLIENRPNSRIVLMTPIHRYGRGTSGILGTNYTYDYLDNGVGANLEDYVNAIKDIGNKYSLHVIDLFNLFTLDPTIESVRTQYIPDGLHPNADGHAILADVIATELGKIMPVNNRYIESDINKVSVQIGNDYGIANLDSTNRISVKNNVYLESGTVIQLKDASTYKFALYSQEGEQIVYSSNITGGYITSSYTITSDGWYGFALAKNNNTDFNLGGTDPTLLVDYLSFIEEPKTNTNVTLDIGNDYGASYVNTANRATVTKNIYLKSGTVVSLKNPSSYKYSVYSQASEALAYSSNISGGFISSNYTITSDGWYGFVLAKVNDSNFDLGGTDSNLLTNYLNFS